VTLVSLTDWNRLLSAGDDVLFGAGAILTVSAALYWMVALRRDPLADIHPLPNAVRPDAILVPFCAWLLAGSIATGFAGEESDHAHNAAARFFIDNSANIFGGAACLWVGTLCFPGGSKSFLIGAGRFRTLTLAAAACFLAAIAVCTIVYHLSLWAFREFEPEYPVFDHEVIDRLRSGEAAVWATWLGTALIAPVAEECFFRGILQNGLMNLMKNRWLGVAASAALFGALHAGGPDHPQPHVVPALAVFGVMLGVLYLRTGSLLAPVVAHALFNAKTLAWETLYLHGR